ncbi:DUF5677 domain-containing protein [Priestia megaterium]|uniref:DUF5677 domain-containing protein n=1 Tax=Priestia megaterium TaxID=1404 RepID=UPI0026973A6F|nr:DUF5677 domain-containing protein [Priestia megaterium]
MNKQEKIQYAYSLTKQIKIKLLKENSPHVIMNEHEYLREVMTLYAKQTNLLHSTLILLNNNHAEEAYILLRSILSNSMLINYLCKDNKRKDRYENYLIQPNKAELSFLYDIREAARKGWVEKTDALEEKIREHEEFLINNGFTTRNKKEEIIADTWFLSIRRMALTDKYFFFIYMLFYKESSEYEHSDFMSLSIYRQQIINEISGTVTFKLNLTKTNPELSEKVLNLSIIIYSVTFEEIFKHIKRRHPQMFSKEQLTELDNIRSGMSENAIHFPYDISEETFASEETKQ